MSEHRSVTIPLKMIEVDVEMVPLIQLINMCSDTYTIYHCQGNRYQYSAYVMFWSQQKYGDAQEITKLVDFLSEEAVGKPIGGGDGGWTGFATVCTFRWKTRGALKRTLRKAREILKYNVQHATENQEEV